MNNTVPDLSKPENKPIIIKPEQIHKMTIIFTQDGPNLSFN